MPKPLCQCSLEMECDCTDMRHPLLIYASCHSFDGLAAEYDRRAGVLTLKYIVCLDVVAELQIAS